MAYFVTGATGFIGRFLVANSVKRGKPIYVLVRKCSSKKLDALREYWGADDKQVIAVIGDLAKKNLGVADADLRKLKGKIEHFFHLAAIYDLKASRRGAAGRQRRRHAPRVEFAEAVTVGCFQHVSSIAAAGLYDGVFREDMFEEAEDLDHPYFKTKHDSEALVRSECKRPFRIYRPGFVVGHSKTGYIDKIDGPYYFFKTIQKMRELLPPWMPMIGIEGGRINIVPVDFVADALDYLAHKKGLDGKCFHLTDPASAPDRRSAQHLRARGARAADDDARQRPDVRLHPGADPLRHRLARAGEAHDPRRAERPRHSARRIPVRQLADPLRQPRGGEGAEGLGHRGAAARHVCAASCGTTGSGNLDPDLFIDRTLAGRVQRQGRRRDGRLVGHRQGDRAQARGSRREGAHRRPRSGEAVEATRKEIEAAGGKCFMYTCDLADMAAIDALAQKILAEHGVVDFLVNNAGRSIRRACSTRSTASTTSSGRCSSTTSARCGSSSASCRRWLEQKRGHIINICSIGVLSHAPRFSAYVASKAALDAFSACAASEFLDKGVHFTTINMPLVRTPMIAPTKMYENVPTLSPEEAAALVVEAIVHRPVRIATRLGIFGAVCHAIAPRSRRCCSTPRSTCSRTRRRRRARRAASRSRSRRSRWRSLS